MTEALFITGTDTDVGKTYVTCELAHMLRSAGATVGALKPLCTGVTPSDGADVAALAEATGQSLEEVAGQTFAAPLSPPSAALAENAAVDRQFLNRRFNEERQREPDYLLVEGAGGLCCPVTDEMLMVDLIVDWNLPVVIVGGIKLGAINHTLLTCQVARSRGLSPAVILSQVCAEFDAVAASTVSELAERLGSQLVAVAPFQGGLLKFDPGAPTIRCAEDFQRCGPPLTVADVAVLTTEVSRPSAS